MFNFINKFFVVKKNYQEAMIKSAELENRLLQNSVELQILRKTISSVEDKVKMLSISQHKIAEEISTIYEIIKSMMSSSSSSSAYEISYEDFSDDDDGNNNLN
tara:strand:- start:475 stop:783 length:309 start_codon:yes stop_codon:yes gene_type:complete